MTSVLKVDTIQNSSGTGALSIDSSGRMTNSQPIGFHCRQNNGFATTSTTLTKIDDWISTQHGGFNTGLFNESTGVVTIPKTGYYIIQSDVRADNFAGNYIYLTVRRWDGSAFANNGDDRIAQTLESATATDYTALHVQAIAYLTSGDQYALGTGNQGDNDVDINQESFFSMWYLG